MEIALLVARLLLAAVFLVAGAGKLLDLAGSGKAMRAFGLPSRLATPSGFLLPLAEIAIAIALVPLATAGWAAAAALVLLALFVAGIGVNLARGRRPDCHCFGALHSAPIGWPTLLRNFFLAATAGFVTWQAQDDAGASAFSWGGGLGATETAGLVVAAALFASMAGVAWMLLNVLLQNGRLLRRVESLEGSLAAHGIALVPSEPAPAGLPVGGAAPAFALGGLFGETMTLDALRASGKPVLLTFTDPHCGPCTDLLPDIGRWQRELAASMGVAVISRGTIEDNRAKTTDHGLTHVLLQQDREVATAYLASATPSAVLVQADGTIASPLAEGSEQIRALVSKHGADRRNGHVRANGAVAAAPLRQAAPAAQAAPPTLGAEKIGQPAPPLRLPDLAGKFVNLADYHGSKTLLLFWNPGCGYCQQMLPEIKAWEEKPPVGAPKLLVVSTGSVADNRALGFRSPLVLDATFATGRAFGATGTPNAVLVDEEGKIASGLASGATGVMALASGQAVAVAANGNGVRPVAKVGEMAPAIRLPDLDGRVVSLASYKGSEMVVLFWNPSCAFCDGMLAELKASEGHQQKGARKLLVISTGDADAIRALGLRAPVLLDPGSTAAAAFGANGTPTAVLIDARGRVGSPVAAGAEQVLALARGWESVATITA